MRRFSRLRPSPAMVVACIALFVAMGGAAYAAATIGSNQIIDNSIRGRDVRNEDLRGRDIADSSLGTSDIANDSIKGRDVKGDALDGTDINEASLDVVQRLFAVVTDPAGATNAALARGQRVSGVSEPAGGGVNVQFNRDVNGCAWTANRNDPTTQVAIPGWAQVRLVPGLNNTLEVRVYNPGGGAPQDDDFHLVVTC